MEDWAGNYGVMPGGEKKNVLEFSGVNELVSFMKGDLVLSYKWSTKLKLSAQSKAGLKWLQDEDKRRVGPVEWEQVRVNEDVAALQPIVVSPE